MKLNFFQKFTRVVNLFSLIILLLSFQAHSNTVQPLLKFTNISTDQGLSQSYVFSITQDNQGFIWIATEDGLNRYDGKNFVHYRHNINNKHSVADNRIRKVFVDNTGTLWVGTENGLSRYNADLDNFDNYLNIASNNNSLRDNVVWEIYQDNQKTLWISTAKGLNIYNRQHNNFKRINISNAGHNLTEIRTFFQDKKNNYWIGTYSHGIYIANNKLSYAISLQTKNKWNLNIPAKTLYDIKNIDDQLWLATDQGLYTLDNNNHVNRHFTKKNTLNNHDKLLSNKIRNITLFDDSHVWIATQNGLNIIDLSNNNIASYQSSNQPKSLSENWILTLFKDNNNTMWLGNFATGIDVYRPVSSLFTHRLLRAKNHQVIVSSFTESSDHKIWFASEQLGLNYITANNTFHTVNIAIGKNIYIIKAARNNQLWLLTYSNELYQYNIKTKQLTKHSKWQKYSHINRSFSFVITDNSLWFTNEESLLTQYNPARKTFTHFHPKQVDRLKALQKDNDNNLYISSNKNKLYKFDTKNHHFSTLKIRQNSDFRVSETMNISIDKHWIWLSSYSQGVMLVKRSNLTTSVFNENKGLINNNLNANLIDNKNNAWLSATNGISVINPYTKTIQNFTQDFGLNDNDFLHNSALSSTQGIFYFGGLNGFQQFDPNKVLATHQLIPIPVLTNLLLANKKVTVSKTNLPSNENKREKTKEHSRKSFTIKQQINSLKQLTLAYKQSPFSIEFTSPNSKLPSQIRYRYKLVGLEKNWITAGRNNQRATYTNLSAGHYTFVVQAYDLYHPAQKQTKRLPLQILPPWWLSNLAYCLYGIIVLLVIVYFILQLRRRRKYHLQIQQSEERLKLSLWGSGDEMWDWNITTGKIYRSNIWGVVEFPQDGIRNSTKAQQAIQQSKYQSQSQSQNNKLTTLQQQSNIHPQDFARVHQSIEQHIQNNSGFFEATYRVKNNTKKGQWIWVLDRGKIVDHDKNNQPCRMTGTLKDISQIKTAEERLKLFAQCIASISDAVIIYDRQFKVIDVNLAYEKITGKTKASMLNHELFFSLYPESFTQTVKKNILTQGSWHGEIENKRSNNELYYIDLNIDIIKDNNNNVSHFVGVFSDITERKSNEKELRKLANSDTLTGLPNRSYFQVNQTHLVQNNIPHALLIFDLDNFKKINDSLGHEVGDLVLCQIAKRIIASSRKQDTVYRLGGDEFGLVIRNTNDIHTITSIAQKILKNIAQPLRIKNHELVLYTSIGIVLYPEDGASSQELLKNADTAMYHAKDNNGNQYQFFNDSMNKQVVKRLQIEHLIRYGLNHDYFSVFYQPKIEIATGKIAGMEALVRFEHPSKGIISPITFIPISEETGQVIDIGEVVLRKACFATKEWVDTGLFDGRIAVNLSAVQFTQPNLVDIIAGILIESQLPAKYLELEITEGTVMDSPQAAIDIMEQIRAMGIHLSLDDFGTGYSSLAYLKKFPLNTLKIDKAFVDDIEHSEQGRNMVATIVTIAHNLGLHVVAEGVEQQLQLDFLAGLKCEQLQGYLYSKPLTEQDFYKYLLAHKITTKSTHFS